MFRAIIPLFLLAVLVAAAAGESNDLYEESNPAVAPETSLVARRGNDGAYRRLPGMKVTIMRGIMDEKARLVRRRRTIALNWKKPLKFHFKKLGRDPKIVDTAFGKKVHGLGYTWQDAYNTPNKYYLGPSRRRIGAGFGRRRRAAPGPRPGIPIRYHRMLDNNMEPRLGKRLPGLKSDKKRRTKVWMDFAPRKGGGRHIRIRRKDCKPCVDQFVARGGCRAVLYSKKRTAKFLPAGCRKCARAASAKCLFVNKMVRWKKGGRRTRKKKAIRKAKRAGKYASEQRAKARHARKSTKGGKFLSLAQWKSRWNKYARKWSTKKRSELKKKWAWKSRWSKRRERNAKRKVAAERSTKTSKRKERKAKFFAAAKKLRQKRERLSKGGLRREKSAKKKKKAEKAAKARVEKDTKRHAKETKAKADARRAKERSGKERKAKAALRREKSKKEKSRKEKKNKERASKIEKSAKKRERASKERLYKERSNKEKSNKEKTRKEKSAKKRAAEQRRKHHERRAKAAEKKGKEAKAKERSYKEKASKKRAAERRSKEARSKEQSRKVEKATKERRNKEKGHKARRARERRDKIRRVHERTNKEKNSKRARERAVKAHHERRGKAAERSGKERSSKERNAKERNNKARARERAYKSRFLRHGQCCWLLWGCRSCCDRCPGGHHWVWPHKCGTSRRCNRL